MRDVPVQCRRQVETQLGISFCTEHPCDAWPCRDLEPELLDQSCRWWGHATVRTRQSLSDGCSTVLPTPPLAAENCLIWQTTVLMDVKHWPLTLEHCARYKTFRTVENFYQYTAASVFHRFPYFYLMLLTSALTLWVLWQERHPIGKMLDSWVLVCLWRFDWMHVS